jgi:Txe/YoeB family toxin of Txe-Axe toxin-antitoxin module
MKVSWDLPEGADWAELDPGFRAEFWSTVLVVVGMLAIKNPGLLGAQTWETLEEVMKEKGNRRISKEELHRVVKTVGLTSPREFVEIRVSEERFTLATRGHRMSPWDPLLWIGRK